MSESTKIKIGRRLEKVFQELFIREKVQTKLEFSEKMGTRTSTLNDMIKGERSPTLEHLSNLWIQFKINPLFLLLNKGDIYFHVDEEPIADTAQEAGEIYNSPQMLMLESKHLRQEIASQKKIIELLENQLLNQTK